MQHKIMTVKDVAAAIGVGVDSFYALLSRGTIKPPPPNAFNNYWWIDDIKPWLDSEIQRRLANKYVRRKPPRPSADRSSRSRSKRQPRPPE
jgi:hypothetical protein